MADKFGLKIGIEGEAQFKQALRDINQSFKLLGSEMALATSQFDRNDKSVAALTSRNTVLTKEIDTQKGKIETLKAVLDNAATSFGENDKRTQSWQMQLNRAEAELNGMERELKANNAALQSNSDRYDTLGREIEETAREYVKIKKEYGENSTEAKTLEQKLKDLSVEHKAAGKAADQEEKAISDVTKSLGLYQRETQESAKETSLFGTILKATLTADAIKAGGKARNAFHFPFSSPILGIEKRRPNGRRICLTIFSLQILMLMLVRYNNETAFTVYNKPFICA